MSLFNVFSISGSGMSAQAVRINTIASNLSNAENVAGSPDKAYKARYPIFAAIEQRFIDGAKEKQMGVEIKDVITSRAEPRKEYQPGHPLADDNGYIYLPNVSSVEEMANMISASRSYQMNAQVMNATTQLILMRI